MYHLSPPRSAANLMHCAVLCRETVLVRFCGGDGELEFVEILDLALFDLLNLYLVLGADLNG